MPTAQISLKLSLSHTHTQTHYLSSASVCTSLMIKDCVLHCQSLVCPGVGVHRSTSLMISFLLLWMSRGCLAKLGSKEAYSSFLVECYFRDIFFKVARNILQLLPSNFFSRNVLLKTKW